MQDKISNNQVWKTKTGISLRIIDVYNHRVKVETIFGTTYTCGFHELFELVNEDGIFIELIKKPLMVGQVWFDKDCYSYTIINELMNGDFLAKDEYDFTVRIKTKDYTVIGECGIKPLHVLSVDIIDNKPIWHCKF